MRIELNRIDGTEDDYRALRAHFLENAELNGIGVCNEWDDAIKAASGAYPAVTVEIRVVTRYEDYRCRYRDGRRL